MANKNGVFFNEKTHYEPDMVKVQEHPDGTKRKVVRVASDNALGYRYAMEDECTDEDEVLEDETAGRPKPTEDELQQTADAKALLEKQKTEGWGGAAPQAAENSTPLTNKVPTPAKAN